MRGVELTQVIVLWSATPGRTEPARSERGDRRQRYVARRRRGHRPEHLSVKHERPVLEPADRLGHRLVRAPRARSDQAVRVPKPAQFRSLSSERLVPRRLSNLQQISRNPASGRGCECYRPGPRPGLAPGRDRRNGSCRYSTRCATSSSSTAPTTATPATTRQGHAAEALEAETAASERADARGRTLTPPSGKQRKEPA